MVTLDKLDDDDEDLDVDNLYWDEYQREVAHWDHGSLAKVTESVCAKGRAVPPMTMASALPTQ